MTHHFPQRRLPILLPTLLVFGVVFGAHTLGAAQNPAGPPPSPAAQQLPPEISLEPPPPLVKQNQPGHIPEPLLLAAPPETVEPPASREPLTAAQIIRAILGLVAAFALAYLGGHPKVQSLERRLRISHLVTAGLPFVFLGVIAHLPAVGILSDAVLWQIRPLLALGLGWIGFSVGFRFNALLVDSLSPGMAAVGALTAGVPFLTVAAFCGALLLWTQHSPADPAFVRDALLLGTAGAMTAQSAPHLLKTRGGGELAFDRVWSIVQLEQLAGVAGLMLVAAYFRPQGPTVAWQLPGTAWLFITLGMGTTMGGVIAATLGKIKAGPEFSLLLLGSICFTAGMASFLRLSPIAVCFIAGVVVVNLPGRSKQHARAALIRLERPIYLLFLLIAGSLWDLLQWEGWALMAVFVLSRLVGKWLGAKTCGRGGVAPLTPAEQRSLVLAPLGALSIAIVINAQDLYFTGTVPWMVTAVIGGAIVTEILVQLSARNLVPLEEAGAPAL
ncbi:MAG TPA: hypothetical protein VKV15_18150 [Bryobacteraceae bacterium]|nr:hypothetical protein [Bryobacteraceae bacterium]